MIALSSTFPHANKLVPQRRLLSVARDTKWADEGPSSIGQLVAELLDRYGIASFPPPEACAADPRPAAARRQHARGRPALSQ